MAFKVIQSNDVLFILHLTNRRLDFYVDESAHVSQRYSKHIIQKLSRRYFVSFLRQMCLIFTLSFLLLLLLLHRSEIDTTTRDDNKTFCTLRLDGKRDFKWNEINCVHTTHNVWMKVLKLNAQTHVPFDTLPLRVIWRVLIRSSNTKYSKNCANESARQQCFESR